MAYCHSMSHNHDTTIICPNCGFDAKYNYCARCGQENHLHKDTFVGLIMHFVGHYFHYDSKAWKTMKMLWFKPGSLTIAYREKQRMRYIPPISLYIFISAVFFLAVFFQGPQKTNAGKKRTTKEDSVSAAAGRTILASNIGPVKFVDTINVTQNNKADSKLRTALENKEIFEKMKEKLVHSIPKWFFFMIPIMGFVLLLLFVRRKQLYFVDHTIFSLHFHSFVFSVFLLTVLNPFEIVNDWLSPILVLATIVYFIVALRKTYNITVARSIAYSFIIAFSYCLFLFFVVIGNVLYLMYTEGLFKDLPG